MTALGTALTVFTDVSVCEGCGRDFAIVTDGQRAYVYPVDPTVQVTGETTVSRVGVSLDAACPTDGCHGVLFWRLDGEGGWTGDADARRLLTAYGIGVEV